MPVAGENGQHGRRARGGHPLAADAAPPDTAVGARRLDRSGGDAGDRPLYARRSTRFGTAFRPGFTAWAAIRRSLHSCCCLALAVQWRVALQCLILLGGCWFLVQRQRLRFAAAEKLEESRADSRFASAGGGPAEDAHCPRLRHGRFRARTLSASSGQVPHERAACAQPAALPAAGGRFSGAGVRGGRRLPGRQQGAATSRRDRHAPLVFHRPA